MTINLDTMRTTKALWEERYKERFTWPIFQVRMNQLRIGQRVRDEGTGDLVSRIPARLAPVTDDNPDGDYVQIGRVYYYTEHGQARIADALNEPEVSA